MNKPYKAYCDQAAKVTAPIDISHLNANQQAAVCATDGPVLVLAGAGTGKTQLLAARIAYILSKNLCRSEQLVAVTFTNKAGREIKERICQMIGQNINFPFIGTFHYLASKILRLYAPLVGLQPNFTIIDDKAIHKILKEVLISHPHKAYKHDIKELAELISKWKNLGYDFETIPKELMPRLKGGEEVLFRLYQEKLKQANLCDLDDLILYPFLLLKDRANLPLLQKYQKQFRYIFIDEYQDINQLQYLFIKLLAQNPDNSSPNFFCVGDEDQTIYQWRGADIERILNFEQDFPSAQLFRLEENYRSTQHILKAASHLVAHNKKRYGKTLYPYKEDPSAHKVEIHRAFDDEEECRSIAQKIMALVEEGQDFSDNAILTRTGRQLQLFEACFLQLNIPYQIISSLNFFDKKEIRDVLAYLALITNPSDNWAFERIINTPKREIGPKRLDLIRQIAQSSNQPFFYAAKKLLDQQLVKGAVAANLSDFLKQIAKWRLLAKEDPPAKLIDIIMKDTGYSEIYKSSANQSDLERYENLGQLPELVANFNSTKDLLEAISLRAEIDAKQKGHGVNLMSLHVSKGLEFNNVFLPGWEEGLFPIVQGSHHSYEEQLEEERRLAYVGMTRARQRLFIWYAKRRQRYGTWQNSEASCFLNELPHEHILMPHYQSNEAAFITIEAQAYRKKSRAAPARADRQGEDRQFAIGERVFHKKFGMGTIALIEEQKLEITFDKAGNKKVLSPYIEKLAHHKSAQNDA